MTDHLRHSTDIPETDAPIPGILISSHFRIDSDYLVRRKKGTQDWLVTFTLSGAGIFRLNGQDYTCGSGDVILLSPHTPHHYYTDPQAGHWEFCWAHFVPRPHWVPWLLPENERGLMHWKVAEENQRTRLSQAFQRMNAYGYLDDFLDDELALNALEEVLLLIAKQRSKGLDGRIEKVVRYMTDHLSEQHTVTSLSKLACLSPSRLAHLFKEQTGESLMDMLNKMRLRHAAKLLRHTSRQVGEIANDVGFRSLYYFTRQFSKMYGASPTRFREQDKRP